MESELEESRDYLDLWDITGHKGERLQNLPPWNHVRKQRMMKLVFFRVQVTKCWVRN